MKLLVYSAKEFEIPALKRANNNVHQVTYISQALDTHTAIKAVGYDAICIFSGDDASLVVLEKLKDLGVKYITLRSAGYNNIHIKAAKRYGLRVANTPVYSPYAIAEHATALLLALNRNIILADKQVHAHNFLLDGLMGFDLHGKTIGIVGTGNIGSVMAKIMHGFGCKILGCDLIPDHNLVELCGVEYTDLDELCSKSDVISLHVPLTYENYNLISKSRLSLMKKNAILINTARGSIVDTTALIEALENKEIGAYGADVFDRERGVFFKDNSKTGIVNEQLIKLLSFSNVLLTPHQAFVTEEAIKNIASTTFENINAWETGNTCTNELGYETLITG
ncbi:2-hydroxyacid dehydrogenase [Spongiimicrobium sp. 3-5]|uniref:2-hydroxyacid dehydrogenase n=1 Tax=Spongiimicrobium sp. 3-5 TaxID=3332596 RepID=UPI003980D7B2